jgi:hypothetical protein
VFMLPIKVLLRTDGLTGVIVYLLNNCNLFMLFMMYTSYFPYEMHIFKAVETICKPKLFC